MILMSTKDDVPISPIYKITVMLQTISPKAILYLLFYDSCWVVMGDTVSAVIYNWLLQQIVLFAVLMRMQSTKLLCWSNIQDIQILCFL